MKQVERDDKGLSEVLDSTLIIALGLVLAGVVAMFVFGVFTPVDKSAYLVPQFSIVNESGHSVIRLYDRGGEAVYFNDSRLAKYRAVLYVDTRLGTYRVDPAPAVAVLRPGDTVYVYNSGSGFGMTDSLAGVTFTDLPAGSISVRFVDATSGVLIAKEDLITVPVVTSVSPTATATATPTATVTPTMTTTTTAVTTTTTGVTITPTANVTTTSATPTPTTPPAPLAANFNWASTGASGTVHFTDTSTGGPTSWLWNFGDGTVVTQQSPNHNYKKNTGPYDVTLTVQRSSDGGISSITKRITP